jgi:hypothetical protein
LKTVEAATLFPPVALFFTHTPKKQITQIWNTAGAVAVDRSVSARVQGARTESTRRRNAMKLFCGVMALACVPAAVGGNNVPYPKEKVAEFVVEKLDVTTLPLAIRPKPEKGKKTFGEYGYVTRELDDRDVLEAGPGNLQINIKILEQESAGIYVCVDGQAKDGDNGRIQRVFLLKMKNAKGFLKGRESWKEFEGCPVIGGGDSDSAANAYGG